MSNRTDNSLITFAALSVLYSSSCLAGTPTASTGGSGGLEGNLNKEYIDGFPYTYCQMNEASISAEDCTKVSIPDSVDLPEVGELTLKQITEAISFAGDNVAVLGWRQGFGDWRIPTIDELNYMNSKGYLNDSYYYVHQVKKDDGTLTYQPFSPSNRDVSNVTSSAMIYAPAYVRSGVDGDDSGTNDPSLVCGHEPGQPFNTEFGGGINDLSWDNAKTACVKVMEVNDKTKWFTSNPSEALMKEMGYTVQYDIKNTGDTYAGKAFESWPMGGISGNFATFSLSGNDAIYGEWENTQADRWCNKLSAIRLAGQSGWRLPSQEEVLELYYGSKDGVHTLRTRFGVPVNRPFWTNTMASPDRHIQQGMHPDSQDNLSSMEGYPASTGYVTCILDR